MGLRASRPGLLGQPRRFGAVVFKQFAPELMTMDLQPRRGATPYATAGNWPVIGFCLTILGVFWIRNRASL